MITVKWPWEVFEGRYNELHEVWCASQCFGHDVVIKIYGDFESPEQKLEYAHEIAWRLNRY